MISKINLKLITQLISFFILFQVTIAYINGSENFDVFGIIHFILLGSLILFYSISQKKNSQSIFFLILIYQLFLVTGLFLFYNLHYESPLGFEPIDAVYYDNLGQELQNNTYYESILHLLDIGSTGDVGFPILLKFIYSFPGNQIFNVKLFNIAFHLLTCLFVVKIVRLLYNCKKTEINALILFGLNPISVYFNVSGLKEPFLLLIMSLCFYFLYKANFKLSNKFLNYSLGFIFLLTTGLFRAIYPIFILISFGVFIFFKTRGRYKSIKRFGLLFLGALLFSMVYVVIQEELNQKMAYDIGAISTGKIGRAPGILDYIFGAVSNLIGPLPSFKYIIGQDHLLLQTISNLFKVIFSFFFIIEAYHIIRNKTIKYYPILIIIGFNIMMLTTLVMIGYRFLYPFLSLYFIILAGGFTRLQLGKFHLTKFSIYVLFTIVLITTYNLR